jgi:hypothetical protein
MGVVLLDQEVVSSVQIVGGRMRRLLRRQATSPKAILPELNIFFVNATSLDIGRRKDRTREGMAGDTARIVALNSAE